MQEKMLKAKVGKKKKHPRLPNGFGSIVTLSGNRRRPYMARPPVREFDLNGYPIYDTPIGYFSDWFEAYNALMEYNRNPYSTAARNMTFSEVYDSWFKEKYESNQIKKYSDSAICCSRAAYKNSSQLHDMIFSEINSLHFQRVMDECTLKHASIEHIQNLFKQLSKYALKYDIITKDYSVFTTIKQAEDDEGGVPFTAEEICTLWLNLDVPYVDTILILIYSGFRIGAMPKLEVNLEENYFRGGVKTRASKNRLVPIHSAIRPLVERRMAAGGLWADCGSISFYRKNFQTCISTLGLSPHTPHDCRHTCASLLSSANVDLLYIKLIMGHSLGSDITEDKYIHKTLAELSSEMEKIVVPYHI